MKAARKVRVRLLRAVTYGAGIAAWRLGDVKAVHPALARLMLREGEAERA